MKSPVTPIFNKAAIATNKSSLRQKSLTLGINTRRQTVVLKTQTSSILIHGIDMEFFTDPTSSRLRKRNASNSMMPYQINAELLKGVVHVCMSRAS